MVFLAHSPCLEAAFGHAGPFWGRDYLMRERDEVLCLIREVFSPILERPLGPASPPSCEGLDRVIRTPAEGVVRDSRRLGLRID
jgi:hypothetical protein